MVKSKFANLSLGAMWFGASISIAEILTGTYAASLGFLNGFIAILIGHLLGCVLFFGMAYLGAHTKLSSMRVTKLGFGHRGACIFAGLNALQLFGWSSVMIYNGGLAVSGNVADDINNLPVFLLVASIITILLIVWVLFIKRDSFILNTSTVIALGVICFFLSVVLLTSSNAFSVANDYTFTQVIEFSASMPISWLPVVADYTAKQGKGSAIKVGAVASLSYLLGGCWMYFIGMFSMLKFGADDIYLIMKILPLAGLATFVVIASTVVNSFLDGISAGESVASFSRVGRLNKHIAWIGIGVIIAGFIMALIMMFNNNFVDLYQSFLLYIAAVFGPMAGVIIVRVIFFKRDSSAKNWDILAFVPWLIGFISYEVMLNLGIETVVGTTLPATGLAMLITAIIEFGRNKIKA